jgi:hypothetical protein
VHADDHARHIERLAVRPDAADAADRTLGEGNGEAAEVPVLGDLDAAAPPPPLPPPPSVRVSLSSRKSVAQMMLPPVRMRP